MVIKILLGLGALLLGIWLGLPGRWEQKERDIERAFDQGGAHRNKVKKVFTPLDWFRKKERGSSRRRARAHFRTAAPEPGTTSSSGGGKRAPEEDEDAPEEPAAGRDEGARPTSR